MSTADRQATDLAGRLARLSPVQRALVARLVASDGRPAQTTDPTPTPPSALTVELLDGLSSRTTAPARYKAAVQRFYNTVTAQLDSTESGSYARFLNYGYVPDGIDDRAVATASAKPVGPQ